MRTPSGIILLLALLLLSSAEGQRLQAGERAPAIAIKGLDGSVVRCAPPEAEPDRAGGVTILLFLNPAQEQSVAAVRDLRACLRQAPELAARVRAIAVANGALDEAAAQALRDILPEGGLIVGATDADRSAYKAYGVVALPTTFLIDPAGVIVAVLPGRSAAYCKRLLAGIREALGMEPEAADGTGADPVARRVERLTSLAEDLVRRRRVPEAVAQIEAACEARPEDPQLWLLLGGLFLRLEEAQKARAAFERAAGLDEGERAARQGLAKVLALEEDAEAAERALHAEMRRPPVDPDLYYWLGRVLERDGRVEDALRSYREAYERSR